eukprot:8106894-Alexandrium_andersonii.AAC.1
MLLVPRLPCKRCSTLRHSALSQQASWLNPRHCTRQTEKQLKLTRCGVCFLRPLPRSTLVLPMWLVSFVSAN